MKSDSEIFLVFLGNVLKLIRSREIRARRVTQPRGRAESLLRRWETRAARIDRATRAGGGLRESRVWMKNVGLREFGELSWQGAEAADGMGRSCSRR